MSETLPGDEWKIGAIADDLPRAPIQRVAIVTEAYLPKVDGVSKLATLTARHHMNEGRDVLIFAPWMQSKDKTKSTKDFPILPLVGEKRSEGVIEVVPSLKLWFFPDETRAGIPFRKMDALKRFQPDIVHLFSPATMSWSGIWYAKRHNVPLIANYQTDLPGYTRRYKIGLLRGLAWTVLRFLHNQADLNLIPTHFNIQQLEEKGFKHMRLWARGTDIKRFNPAKRSPEMRKRMLNGASEDNLVVLYVGRLANEKRVDLLEQVMNLEGVTVVIIGKGPLKDHLERQLHKAHFMGPLYGDELATAYASADLFGFTGTNEVAGQVVREAMASGLPVLIPNAGGIIDYVLDGINGYICRPDAEDYAAKVTHIRDNPAHRQRMATNALEYVQQRSWEDTMAELESLYKLAHETKQEKP